jgi:hypothetical protein
MQTPSRQIDRKPEHHAEFPPHVERFLELLQTSWPTAPWDEETDTVAYGRQVLRLSREQTREVYYRLRERHTFRPSVAEVHTLIGELIDSAPIAAEVAAHAITMSPQTAAAVLADPNASQENQAIARKVLGAVPALPATGEGAGRSRAREILNNLRQRSGMPPKESIASTAKYSASNNHG